jgi:hypothetical protein
MQLLFVLLLSTYAIMQVTGLATPLLISREASDLSPSPKALDSPFRLLRRFAPGSNVFKVNYNNVFGQQQTEVTCSASGDSELDGQDVVRGSQVANTNLVQQAPNGLDSGAVVTTTGQTSDPRTGEVNTITLSARSDQRIGGSQVGQLANIGQSAINQWAEVNPNAAAVLVLSFLLNNAHVYLTYTFTQTMKGGPSMRRDSASVFMVSDYGQQCQVSYSTSGSCPLDGAEIHALSSMLNEGLLSENPKGIQPGTPANVDIPQQNINNKVFKASLSFQATQSLDIEQSGKVVDVANNALVQVATSSPNLGVSVLTLDFGFDGAHVNFTYYYQQI